MQAATLLLAFTVGMMWTEFFHTGGRWPSLWLVVPATLLLGLCLGMNCLTLWRNSRTT